MIFHPTKFRIIPLVFAMVSLPLSWVSAAEPLKIVFKNGKSLPISAAVLQGANLLVKTTTPDFIEGQSVSLASATHIYGDRPEALDLGIVLLLTDKAEEAEKLLEPIVAEQKITASIPGNFWLEAARVAVIAHAVNKNPNKVTDLGKEISTASTSQGVDPFVTLGKAVLMSSLTSYGDKESSLRSLASDKMPADVAAYASFFRGNLLNGAKRNKDPEKALEQTMATLNAYLSVSTLYPSGSRILNGAAELKAADILISLNRRPEAITLLNSAVRDADGTLIAEEAANRLKSVK